MFKYTKIGINILTFLFVICILITIFLVNRGIKDNKVSRIIIPQINLSLEISSKQNTKENYAKMYEKLDNLKNNIWLEIYSKDLKQLEKDEIIIYTENNYTYLYKICAIKIITDTNLSYFEDIEANTLNLIEKNADRTITCIQALQVGGISED